MAANDWIASALLVVAEVSWIAASEIVAPTLKKFAVINVAAPAVKVAAVNAAESKPVSELYNTRPRVPSVAPLESPVPIWILSKVVAPV